MAALRGFVFDVDGTLVDSVEAHVEAWYKAFEEKKIPQDREVIHKQIGKGGDKLVPWLLADEGLDTNDASELAKSIDRRQTEIFRDRYLYSIRPLPQASVLLRTIRQRGLKLALASSGKGHEIRRYVDVLGIGNIVDAIVTGSDVSASKPSPDVFAGAVEKLGQPPETLAAVGDTPYDILSAKAAGLRCIALLTSGFRTAELGGAVALYGDPAEMYMHLDEIITMLSK